MTGTAVAKPNGDIGSLMLIIDRAAKDPAFDVAKLEALLKVKQQWDAEEARKAFVVALNKFKTDPPTLTKNKHVKFNQTEYKHATLDQVSLVVGKGLAAVGISHRWAVDQEDGEIKVACVLTHDQGHSERVQMTATADTSGSKNSIQAIGSTVTYLQRYTLLAATGMAVQGQDDDGRTSTAMSESAFADYVNAIDSTVDAHGLEAIWKAIAKVCKETGDRKSYDDLKSRVAAKGKGFTKVKK